jgi:hypothetical protein
MRLSGSRDNMVIQIVLSVVWLIYNFIRSICVKCVDLFTSNNARVERRNDVMYFCFNMNRQDYVFRVPIDASMINSDMCPVTYKDNEPTHIYCDHPPFAPFLLNEKHTNSDKIVWMSKLDPKLI